MFGKAKKDWLSRLLELSKGIPSHGTFGRVFARLDPVQFGTSARRTACTGSSFGSMCPPFTNVYNQRPISQMVLSSSLTPLEMRKVQPRTHPARRAAPAAASGGEPIEHAVPVPAEGRPPRDGRGEGRAGSLVREAQRRAAAADHLPGPRARWADGDGGAGVGCGFSSGGGQNERISELRRRGVNSQVRPASLANILIPIRTATICADQTHSTLSPPGASKLHVPQLRSIPTGVYGGCRSHSSTS